jgi:threonine dehydratase
MNILLRDVPGALARLTSLVAQYRANILHIIHERATKDIPIGFSKVILVLETRGPDHIREIQKGLQEKGYVLQTLS